VKLNTHIHIKHRDFTFLPSIHVFTAFQKQITNTYFCCYVDVAGSKLASLEVEYFVENVVVTMSRTRGSEFPCRE
jgi:hypothetical protein